MNSAKTLDIISHTPYYNKNSKQTKVIAAKNVNSVDVSKNQP